jgi:outer membrane protein assembly factor BamB
MSSAEDHLSLARMCEPNDRSASSHHYHQAARKLRERGGYKEAERCYHSALAMDPASSLLRQELSEMRVAHPGRIRRTLRRLIWIWPAALVCASVIFQAVRERSADAALEKTMALAGDSLSRQDFDAAVGIYSDFVKAHGYTTAAARVRRHMANAERQRSAQLAQRRYAGEALLEEARSAESRLDLAKAIACFARLSREAATEGMKQDAQTSLERLRSEKEDYERKVALARSQEAAGRYQEALESFLAARQCSGRLFDGQKIKVPLLIDSQPRDAEVVDGGSVLGRTPFLMRRGVEEPVNVTLRREGYCDMPLNLTPPLSRAVLAGTLTVLRRPLWTFHGRGVIDKAPGVSGTTAYFASRAGYLYAVDVLTGRRLWERQFGSSGGAYVSAPLVAGDRVVLSAMDGSLQAFARDDGRPLWRRTGLGLPAEQLTYLAGEKQVLLLQADGTARWIAIDQGAETATRRLWSAAAFSTLFANDRLCWATQDGLIGALDMKTERTCWTLKCEGPATQPLASIGNTLIAVIGDSEVLALSLADRKVLWRFKAGSPGVTAPAAGGDRVFVGTRGGSLIALDARDGREVWQVSTAGVVAVSPGADMEKVYVATADGWLSVFRAGDGTLLWKSDLAGAPAASPFMTSGRVLVTARNGTIQAFEP